ncbi:MAG: hypothetical protein HS113_26620 [Verrucomicrobiales bacterium]|nr:hypothetical protein [Verrucomicrobiales bacterium]
MPVARPGAAPPTVHSRGRRSVIEAAGNLCRRVGLPRTVGQIYGLLFLSPQPLSLESIAEQLGISKASVSTGTRQLASWGAIRQVWVPGNRKDHFEAIPEIGGLIRSAYRQIVKPRLDASQKRATALIEVLRQDYETGALTKEEFDFCCRRMHTLSRLQKGLQSFAPLLEQIL